MNKILLYIGLLLSVSLMRADVKDEMQSLREWKAGAVVSDKAIQSFGIDNCFGVDVISDAIIARMKGKSFKENSKISRSDLRYLRVLHVDNKGAINIGEMVCNQQIANDLVAIFRQLYEARYPIERMVLIDDEVMKTEKDGTQAACELCGLPCEPTILRVSIIGKCRVPISCRNMRRVWRLTSIRFTILA